MIESNFTNESNNLFKYIKDKLLKEYPFNKINIDYFLLAILENHNCIAYQMLLKTSSIQTLYMIHSTISQSLSRIKLPHQVNDADYDIVYDTCAEFAKNEFNIQSVNSGYMLLSILKTINIIGEQFNSIGLTYEQLLMNLNIILSSDNEEQSKDSIVDDLLEDINKLAKKGEIDEVIGNDDIINMIFGTLCKRNKNNVMIVGDSGIGKTATVLHIANLLNKGDVPALFKDKKLMKLDFTKLIAGASLRGVFESKFNAIIDAAKTNNKYIFFIDDIQSILSDKSKFSEINTDKLLDMILCERNIMFICTIDNKSYSSHIINNSLFKRRFNKIQMNEKPIDEIIQIVKSCKEKYEKFHNVTYTDEAIETCIKLIKKYVKDSKLPDYVFDILDEAGAKIKATEKEDSRISSHKNILHNINNKIKQLDNSTNHLNYEEEYNKLKDNKEKEENELKKLENEIKLSKQPIIINEDEIRNIISKKINIPVTKLTENETNKLKNLNNKLKTYIVGQDDAVDEVCRVVKRQRIGMSNSNRPSVLFFVGMTGTGKTYLAKKLAEEIFGDEKLLVRLDMSEYSDKMSVNKLYGAASGYIGYDKGGILTEAVKKNNNCVLLLDEIEKANDDVYNVFLQLFDDGRLTDNMGNIVDFSNVIVIMTSNVGTKELNLNGSGIGFVKNESLNRKETIKKAMKKKFNPEFINRIDSIVYFNKLTEHDIKIIIKNELNKLDNKLKNIEYILGESLKNEDTINYIYDIVKEKDEYGARPILYTIQHEIEDKITDYIIDNQPPKNFIFEKNIIN